MTIYLLKNMLFELSCEKIKLQVFYSLFHDFLIVFLFPLSFRATRSDTDEILFKELKHLQNSISLVQRLIFNTDI